MHEPMILIQGNPARSVSRVMWRAHRPVARLLVLMPMLALASCALPPSPASAPPAPVASQAKAPSFPVPAPPAPAAATPTVPPAAPPPEVVQETPPVPSPVDKGAALRKWVDQQNRIYRVAAPLLINNTELCPRHVKPILGFTAKNRYSFSREFIDAAQSSLGLGEELRVMNVLPGSGAAQAGLREGDVLAAVEIEPAPQGPDAEHMAAALIGEEMQGRDSLHLTVMRAGERMAFDVPLTPACAMALDLGNTEDARSFSDGRRVMVTRGMLDFAQSDDELAYALAREIARNEVTPEARPAMAELIDHLHTIDARTASGDAPAAAQDSYSASDDSADKLAIYLLARAGYDIDGFQSFWERLESAGQPDLHPATTVASARMPTVDQTIREVKTKKEDGLPLLP